MSLVIKNFDGINRVTNNIFSEADLEVRQTTAVKQLRRRAKKAIIF